MQMRPPSACTARVTLRCRATMPRHRQSSGERRQPAFDARRDAAGDDQADAAARAFGEKRGELVEIARVIFEAGVHRSHQHAIRQRREAEIERREQMRILRRATQRRSWLSNGRLNDRLVGARCPENLACRMSMRDAQHDQGLIVDAERAALMLRSAATTHRATLADARPVGDESRSRSVPNRRALAVARFDDAVGIEHEHVAGIEHRIRCCGNA